MNRPTPPPPFLCVHGLREEEKPLGVVSAKSAEVSLEVSQVSVMPRRLIFLLVSTQLTYIAEFVLHCHAASTVVRFFLPIMVTVMSRSWLQHQPSY